MEMPSIWMSELPLDVRDREDNECRFITHAYNEVLSLCETAWLIGRIPELGMMSVIESYFYLLT